MIRDGHPGPRDETRTVEDENIVDLLGRLTHQGSHLAQEQLNLVQAEMRQAVNDIKQAVAAGIRVVVTGIAGLSVLLMGVAFGLGAAIENIALGTIIVGAIALLIAGVLYATARSKLSVANLEPDRSIDTLERTPDAARCSIHR